MQRNSTFNLHGERLEIRVALLDGGLMTANRTIGGLEEKHWFASFLSHGHQRPIILKLGQSVAVIIGSLELAAPTEHCLCINFRCSIKPALESLRGPAPA